jgi:hypothetical protein
MRLLTLTSSYRAFTTASYLRVINSYRRYSARQQQLQHSKQDIETRKARIHSEAVFEQARLKRKSVVHMLERQNLANKEQAECRIGRTLLDLGPAGDHKREN